MSSDSRALIVLASLLAGGGGSLAAQQPETTLLNGMTREIACAPASPLTRPAMPLRVAAGNDARKTLFGTGDALVIRGGTAQGVRPGDEYFVRRLVDDRFTEHAPGVYPISISTAGMVRIAESQTDFSIAVVTYACDGIIVDDYLERFERPNAPSSQVGNTPDFARPGHLILGGERRQTASAGQFMVLDRGSDHGLRVGQQLTIFRNTVGGAGPVATIGSATVYVVRPESSTIRIEKSIDAVYVGDLVAIHR